MLELEEELCADASKSGLGLPKETTWQRPDEPRDGDTTEQGVTSHAPAVCTALFPAGPAPAEFGFEPGSLIFLTSFIHQHSYRWLRYPVCEIVS